MSASANPTAGLSLKPWPEHAEHRITCRTAQLLVLLTHAGDSKALETVSALMQKCDTVIPGEVLLVVVLKEAFTLLCSSSDAVLCAVLCSSCCGPHNSYTTHTEL